MTHNSRSILKSEVEYPIKFAKVRKTVSPDEISTEIIKEMGKTGLDMLTDLFNKIYDVGQLPNDWLQSIFMPVPKKNNPKECRDYRLFSLMSSGT